jgi:hypothetical protein
MRVLKGRPAKVWLPLENLDGELVQASSTPSVACVDGYGVPVTGLSTPVLESEGVYTTILPPQPVLDDLIVTLTAQVDGVTLTAVETIEVVGGRVIHPARLREDPALRPLKARSVYRVAEAVEDWLRDALDYPPVPEGLRVSFDYEYSSPVLWVPGVDFPLDLYNAEHFGTEFTLAELQEVRARQGGFVRISGRSWPAGDYQLHLSHGRWVTPPEDLVRAAAALARYVVRESKLPERATSVQTEGAFITLAMPDHEHPTGLPDVDGTVNRYRAQRYV